MLLSKSDFKAVKLDKDRLGTCRKFRIYSVPLEIDWDTNIGPEDADITSYTLQSVIPVVSNDEWYLISRTIVSAYIDAESPVAGGNDLTGNSDILQSFFFSPQAPTADGWIWGAGPAMTLPVASPTGWAQIESH